MSKRIAHEWLEFKKAVMPEGASVDQSNDMRRSFYAGVTSLFFILTTQVSEGDEVRQVDLDMMDEIQAEIFDFRDDVALGRK